MSLMRFAIVACALIVSGRGAASPSAPWPTEPPLEKAGAAYRAGDCKGALGIVMPLIDGPAVASYPPPLRNAAYGIAVQCSVAQNQNDDAYRLALAGTQTDSASDYLWRYRLWLELTDETTDRSEAAVTTIERIAHERPAQLDALPYRWFYGIEVKLEARHADDARRRMLAILADPAYQPVERPSPKDTFRSKYAELLYEAGDTKAAFALIALIESPEILIDKSIDPRFRPALPADFDPRAAIERHLPVLAKIAQQNPEALDAPLQEARLLQRLGRPQAALDLLQALKAANPPGFAEKANWWWNAVAYSQSTLGHYDEAAAAMTQGSQGDEEGGLNVSQVINLSDLQILFGRPREALKTLAIFDSSNRSLSPFGRMQLHAARGCAAALVGDTAQMQTEIAFARAHDADAEGTLRSLLLCANDLDGAAAEYIHALDDPKRRMKALKALSDFDPLPPGAPTGPYQRPLAAIKARADVKAAIARAGGVRRIDLQDD